MRGSKTDIWTIAVYSICIVLVILVSWISYMYGGSVRNLLSAEGIRHTIKYALADYTDASPSVLLFVTAVTGVLLKSGVGNLLRLRHLSLKQRSAIGITLFTGILYLVLLLLGLFLPHAVLLGVTGHIERSVLADGWVLITSIWLLLIGIVYGIASGAFRHFQNIVSGLSYGIYLFAPCFITLFLGTQLLSCLSYAGLFSCSSENSFFLLSVRCLILYFPFLIKCFYIVSRKI